VVQSLIAMVGRKEAEGKGVAGTRSSTLTPAFREAPVTASLRNLASAHGPAKSAAPQVGGQTPMTIGAAKSAHEKAIPLDDDFRDF
jgi:hypothetical protein